MSEVAGEIAVAGQVAEVQEWNRPTTLRARAFIDPTTSRVVLQVGRARLVMTWPQARDLAEALERGASGQPLKDPHP